MKIRSIKNFLAQLACWILLLQLMNIAIDPRDPNRFPASVDQSKEDLSINETESIYELVSEGLFDTEVPETDEKDTDTNLTIFDYYCLNLADSDVILTAFQLAHKPYDQSGLLEYFPPFDAPPPKIG
ncbi:MAG: hypothetical protein Q7T76_04790 [Ferruginibacter sp.]|nr:hypothetical protein [Ferruginibacter sp.]